MSREDFIDIVTIHAGVDKKANKTNSARLSLDAEADERYDYRYELLDRLEKKRFVVTVVFLAIVVLVVVRVVVIVVVVIVVVVVVVVVGSK